MKMIHLPGTLVALLLSICCSAAASSPDGTKKRILADLDSIQSIFEVKYAPKPWKYQFANWELDEAISAARQKIENTRSPNLKECQVVLRDFFNSTKDYHVGIRFYSTETASLPFVVKGTAGRYFVCYVDREQISKREFPFDEGDEILTFGSQPVHQVIEELRLREYGENTLETDQALAQAALTLRRGDMGQTIPSGKVEITGLKKGSKKPQSVTLQWQYAPEKIRDFSKLGIQTTTLTLDEEFKTPQGVRTALKNSPFLNKMMVAHLWDKSYVGPFTGTNRHSLGGRSSFIPALGKKIWRSVEEDIFDAYIFESPSGKKIGYIRIPHYVADKEEAFEFGNIINQFQRKTDGLIIDQVNNPGGSVFYLYALVSSLTDKPLYSPKHHIAITQEEVYFVQQLLPILERVTTDEAAHLVFGENIGGYPVNMQFVRLMKEFCRFVAFQWEKGNILSDPTFLFGVDEILPHPKFRYTKPILVLVNSLDFSGGDFFPAILQDNGRATILGTRTAGAGGYVMHTVYPNHSGIKGFAMTGSLAERINDRPIENLGVTPDIQYELTVNDLQNNYPDYVAVILETIESIAQNNLK